MNLRVIHIVLLCLLALAIPIYQKGVLSLIILLLSVLSIIRINPKRKVAWGTIMLTGLLIFSLQFISLLWSEDVGVGLKNLETKLSLCLLPLIVGTAEPLSKRDYGAIKGNFLLGLLISSIILIGRAVFRTETLEDISAFYYVELAGIFHPSYLSLYVVCGVAMLLLDTKLKPSSAFNKWVTNGFVVLLILFTVLLSSKAGLISLVIVLGAYIIKTFIKRRPSAEKLISLGFMLVLFGLVAVSPTAVQRVKSGTVSTTITKVDPNDPINSSIRNTTAVRLIAWKASLDLMNEKPLGSGLGDSKQALLNKYESQEEYFMLDRKFNAHNQFLEMGLSTGWLGLILLVASLLLLFLRAVHLKDWVQAVIIMVIVFNLCTESMLERQSGAVFIPFVLCLLAFRDFNGNPENTEEEVQNNLP